MKRRAGKIYADNYRAGRRATRWERFKWLMFHHRAKVEDWITDDDSGDIDFLIIVFMTVMLALAGVVMVFAARG